MEVNRISYSPNFKARVLVDDSAQKYVKASFSIDYRDTMNTLDQYNDIHRDSIVNIKLKSLKNRAYLVAKNLTSNKQEAQLVKKQSHFSFIPDQFAFIKLLNKTMESTSFWKR